MDKLALIGRADMKTRCETLRFFRDRLYLANDFFNNYLLITVN